jgi:hypothetical protein
MINSTNDFLKTTKSKNRVDWIKFVLYIKNREIDAVNLALNKALNLSKLEQQQWIIDNGEVINQALDLFVDESNLVLDKISMDEEVLELTQQLIFSLRDAMDSAYEILGEHDQLES